MAREMLLGRERVEEEGINGPKQLIRFRLTRGLGMRERGDENTRRITPLLFFLSRWLSVIR